MKRVKGTGPGTLSCVNTFDAPLPVPASSPAQFLAGLAGPIDFPLHDRDPDPGLFGPDSITWMVLREPLLMLGAPRALLLQAAHPLVAQGALDHSNFATDPRGRFERTVAWVTSVVFGTTAEARAACRGINRAHQHVAGTLPSDHSTASWAAGTSYSAKDPSLLRWVHLTLVHTLIATHDLILGSLDEDDRDRFVTEWNAVGRLMGVGRQAPWTTWRGLDDEFKRMVATGAVLPGAGARQVADTVLHPDAPLVLRPFIEASHLVTAGLLPRSLRRGYGISWTPVQTLSLLTLQASLRVSLPLAPRPLRVSPAYDVALQRTQGVFVPAPAPARTSARGPVSSPRPTVASGAASKRRATPRPSGQRAPRPSDPIAADSA